MSIKKPEGPLEYEAEAVWNGRMGGVVTLPRGDRLQIDMATEFGGLNEAPSPDDLFAASLSGCLLTTAIWFAKKMELNITELAVKVKTKSELVQGGFKITKIWVTMKVVGPPREKAERLADLAERYCHLTRTLRGCVDIEFTLEYGRG